MCMADSFSQTLSSSNFYNNEDLKNHLIDEQLENSRKRGVVIMPSLYINE